MLEIRMMRWSELNKADQNFINNEMPSTFVVHVALTGLHRKLHCSMNLLCKLGMHRGTPCCFTKTPGQAMLKIKRTWMQWIEQNKADQKLIGEQTTFVGCVTLTVLHRKLHSSKNVLFKHEMHRGTQCCFTKTPTRNQMGGMERAKQSRSEFDRRTMRRPVRL